MPKRRSVGSENLIGQNVILLRKRMGINQDTLLSRLQVRGIDISQTTLSDIEGQKRRVFDKELLALADVLGVPLDALFHPELLDGPGDQ